MKVRLSMCLITLALLLGMVTSLGAQVQPSISDAYTVKNGDTGWELSREFLGNPTTWRQIVEKNPFLQEKGRVTEKGGKIYLMLHVGEKLVGLQELGILPTPVPLDQLLPPKTDDNKTITASVPWYMNHGLWGLFFAMFVVGVIIAVIQDVREQQRLARQSAARELELAQNPVTSGPPIVAGGIPATDAQRLSDHFQDRAVAQYVSSTPGTDAVAVRPNIIRVGPIEEGTIFGEGLVGYADRTRPRRIDPAQPGYRATFRFPDGSEQQLMSLQRCMNPCMYGEGMSGFTFNVGRVVVSIPTPQAPAPQAVPHPTMAIHAIRAGAESEGHSTLAIGNRIITFDRGVHLTVDEATGHVNVSGGSFDMMVKPKRSQLRNRAKKSESA